MRNPSRPNGGNAAAAQRHRNKITLRTVSQNFHSLLNNRAAPAQDVAGGQPKRSTLKISLTPLDVFAESKQGQRAMLALRPQNCSTHGRSSTSHVHALRGCCRICQ
jgi:hypothetical protein